MPVHADPIDAQALTEDDRTRFWSKVDRSAADGCWPWTSTLHGDGYGHFHHGGPTTGSPRRVLKAHRVAYALEHGHLEAGVLLDHECSNEACCRPSHLRPMEHRENVLRGTAPTAVNAALTACRRGHPFTPKNTRQEGRSRRCLTCQRDYGRRRYAARRAGT